MPSDPGTEPYEPVSPEIDPAGAPEEAPATPAPFDDPLGRPYDQ